MQLEISDGTPWWLSPDIWVTETIGGTTTVVSQPEVGKTYRVWAKVENITVGTPMDAVDAVVSFYWADPSTVVTLATATLIGTATVTLPPGNTDVECPIDWSPSWVNNGHECLVATVDHPADPITPPLGGAAAFDPPNHRQIAQLNLSVLLPLPGPRPWMMIYPFGAGFPGERRHGKARLKVRRLPLAGQERLLRARGFKRLPAEMNGIRKFGIQPYNAGDCVKETGRPSLPLSEKLRGLRGMALAVQLPRKPQAGTAALFVVEQLDGKRAAGGVGLLIFAGRGKSR